MGIAEIISGGSNGLYTAQIIFDVGGASSAIDAIDAEISDINEELEIIVAEILTAQAKLNEKKTECYDKSAAFAVIGEETLEAAEESWEQIRDAWEEYTHGGNDGLSYTIRGGSLGFGLPEVFDKNDLENTAEDLPEVAFEIRRCKINWNTAAGKKWSESTQASPAPVPSDGAAADAYLEWMKCAIEQWALQSYLTSVEKFRDLRLYRISSLELRKAQIQTAIANSVSQSMWCADLTEDLTGDVDTIEIDGAPLTMLVGPNGVANIRDDGGSPGYLSNIMAQSPAQTGLAWALLPGWQKWRPTYRVGVITAIDYDSDRATVALDVARSIAQGLFINQADILTLIPVDYMECDSAAFVVGDRVVIEFTGQTWGVSKVIGFETNPKPCTYGVCAAGGPSASGKGVIIFYNLSGVEQWRGTSPYDGRFVDASISRFGVYGVGTGPAPDLEGYIVKFDRLTGDVVWSHGGYENRGTSVVADDTGVYVSMHRPVYTMTDHGSYFTWKIDLYSTITKFSHGGVVLWEKDYHWEGTKDGTQPFSETNLYYLPYGTVYLEMERDGSVFEIGFDSSGGCHKKINPHTGNNVWRVDHGLDVKQYLRSVIAMNGNIYVRAEIYNPYVYPYTYEITVEEFSTGFPKLYAVSVDIESVFNDGYDFDFNIDGGVAVIEQTGDEWEVAYYNSYGNLVWRDDPGMVLLGICSA